MSSTTDSTAVFVKMDPQPVVSLTAGACRWVQVNPPYKPGDTFRDWRYSYVVKSIEPVIRDGAWWWRIGVETRSDP